MQTIPSILEDCDLFERIGGDKGRLARRLKIAIEFIEKQAAKEPQRETWAAKILDAIQEVT